jgi:hypothetical protein
MSPLKTDQRPMMNGLVTAISVAEAAPLRRLASAATDRWSYVNGETYFLQEPFLRLGLSDGKKLQISAMNST